MSMNFIQKVNPRWSKHVHTKSSREKMKIAVIALVLESILPTIRPGVLRDDKSNGEGLMREFQGRNSKFSDGGTLKIHLQKQKLQM